MPREELRIQITVCIGFPLEISEFDTQICEFGILFLKFREAAFQRCLIIAGNVELAARVGGDTSELIFHLVFDFEALRAHSHERWVLRLQLRSQFSFAAGNGRMLHAQ